MDIADERAIRWREEAGGRSVQRDVTPKRKVREKQPRERYNEHLLDGKWLFLQERGYFALMKGGTLL